MRIVVKIGTSSLTDESGRIQGGAIEKLCAVSLSSKSSPASEPIVCAPVVKSPPIRLTISIGLFPFASDGKV